MLFRSEKSVRITCLWLYLGFLWVIQTRAFYPAKPYAILVGRRSCRETTAQNVGSAVLFSYSYDSQSGDLSPSLPTMEKATELWLDLRGTAIHPRVAVNCLMEELREDGLIWTPTQESQLIGKVILSDDSFQKLLNTSDPFVDASEILYQPQGASDGFLASSRHGLSLPFGTSIPMLRDNPIAVRDPEATLRMLGEGKWVLLENEERELDPDKESSRIDAISSFLDIASAAASGPWELATTQKGKDRGLILRNEKPPSLAPKTNNGGVAIHCPTKSFFVRLASAIQCFQSVSTTTMTESGIIIQGGDAIHAPSLPTAIALPFDVRLWKTAMLVYGQEQFRDFQQAKRKIDFLSD